MNKPLSFMPYERAQALSNVIDGSFYPHVVGDKLFCFFYQGVISNFYKAGFVFDKTFLQQLKNDANNGGPIEIRRFNQFAKVADFILNQNYGTITLTCGEQFIMAFKAALCGDTEALHKVLSQRLDPREYKGIGRSVKRFSQHSIEWNQLRIYVCYAIIRCRENQQAEFRRLTDVIETVVCENSHITDICMVEASPPDAIWGCGMNARAAIERANTLGAENYRVDVNHRVFTAGFDKFWAWRLA